MFVSLDKLLGPKANRLPHYLLMLKSKYKVGVCAYEKTIKGVFGKAALLLGTLCHLPFYAFLDAEIWDTMAYNVDIKI